MDCPSPSLPRMTSQDLLQTQSPAHHLPAVRSTSPSPPIMESHFPPWSASQHNAEQLSRGSPRKLSRSWSIPHLLLGPDSASARRPSDSTITHQLLRAPSSLRFRLGRGRWPAIVSGLLSSGRPRRSIPPAPLGSFLPSAPPGSSVAPAPLQISGPPPRSPELSAPHWPPRSSASPWFVGSPSPPRAAPLPLFGPLEPLL